VGCSVYAIATLVSCIVAYGYDARSAFRGAFLVAFYPVFRLKHIEKAQNPTIRAVPSSTKKAN